MALAQSPQPAITVIDDGSAAASIAVRRGQELELELGANPTTGYTWRLQIADANRLRLKSRVFERSESGAPPRPGAGGKERFVFETIDAGAERLHFEYRRGEGGEPARTYDLTVTVLP
jgi:predicted secreted protein